MKKLKKHSYSADIWYECDNTLQTVGSVTMECDHLPSNDDFINHIFNTIRENSSGIWDNILSGKQWIITKYQVIALKDNDNKRKGSLTINNIRRLK